ncbi:MAG: hypothetical protein P9E67_01715 [Candidatus Competibacter sp.]|nr:hypothetical protein [Candidatus Competibacter sp.]
MTDDPHTDSDLVLASDGGALQRLILAPTVAGSGAVLVDAAGIPVNPWEVEPWRWPPEAESALRRGGYLLDRSPDLELWCNCID